MRLLCCERGHIGLEGGLVALEGGDALSVEGGRVAQGGGLLGQVLIKLFVVECDVHPAVAELEAPRGTFRIGSFDFRLGVTVGWHIPCS